MCPACRRPSERGVELSTLAVTLRARVQPGLRGQPDDLVEGILRCTGCGRTYPVIDGLPIIFTDLGALLRTEAAALVSQPLCPEVQAALAAPGPDEAPLTYALESLGAYLDASWGDRATPPPDGPVPRLGAAGLVEKLRARSQAKVHRALEVGCGVGRGLAALREGAGLVVGVDRSPGALKLAQRILRGERVDFPRRTLGRAYAPARIDAGPLACPDVQLVCADVFGLPFAPGTFERVAALNLLDVVHAPRALLRELHWLAPSGGELLLASPYAFRSGVVDEDQRLEGDPVARLRIEAHALGWTIDEEEARVPWTLRRDSRSASVYEVHWLRARRA